MEGIDRTSDEALLKAKSYFANLQAAVINDSTFDQHKRSGANQEAKMNYGRGGLNTVFEYVVSLVTGLINLRLDEKQDNQQPFMSKDSAEKKNQWETNSLACVSHMLVFGPAAIWVCPGNQKFMPKWKYGMLLEFGSLVLESRLKAGLPSDPLRGQLGKTRAYILTALCDMGFSKNQKINWINVIRIFTERFSYEKLAEVLLEDIVLVTDYDMGSHFNTVWAVEKTTSSNLAEVTSEPQAYHS